VVFPGTEWPQMEIPEGPTMRGRAMGTSGRKYWSREPVQGMKEDIVYP
jgi:hypothetical protein